VSSRYGWSLVVVLSALLMAALLAADAGGPIRLLAALWFLLFCPGLAFIWLLPVRSPGEQLALAFVVSIVIDTVVATTILLVGDLSATSGFVALTGISLVAVALQATGGSDAGDGEMGPGAEQPESSY
jgi:hypothetical protein